MFVTHLSLTDFRSYAEVEVGLADGVAIFVGQNGQGKTNLVEAVEFLATLGSHRVASDVPLVRSGAERAIVQARVQAGLDDARSLTLDVEIFMGRANRARINRSPLKRARDILGALRVVLFSPEDLAIVKGDPADRRRFLDDLLVTRWPRLAGVRGDYDRVLRQRNTLLKSLSGRSGRAASPETAATLDAWDSHLARLGAELLVARLTTLADLAPFLAAEYLAIAPSNNDARATYTSSLAAVNQPVGRSVVPAAEVWGADVAATTDPLGDRADAGRRGDAPDRPTLEQALVSAMVARRGEEIARGVSLVGPHRDDVHLALGDLPAKGYASHGESWSLALALRLASYHLLRADGIEPVLVLDDVFAELDTSRRDRLARSIVDAEQVLITAAVEADVPELLGGRRYRVAGGTVVAEDDGVADRSLSAAPGAGEDRP